MAAYLERNWDRFRPVSPTPVAGYFTTAKGERRLREVPTPLAHGTGLPLVIFAPDEHGPIVGHLNPVEAPGFRREGPEAA